VRVLAIRPGDLHVRAAYLGPLDAPAGVEDTVEPTRFVTPSVITLDVGGPLFGYPALMSTAGSRAERVVWRYRRRALLDRAVVARDGHDRGLTSETFLAYAAGRLAWEAQAYAGITPDVALVVPDDLDAAARARLAATSGMQRPAFVIGEDAALLAAVGAGDDGTWLIASGDDDALRLSLVRRAGGEPSRLASEAIAEAGLGALRERWLAEWDAQAAALVPGARAFGGDSYEFERVWQELWELLDAEPADSSRSLAWPLQRRSAVLTVCANAAVLLQDVEAMGRAAVGRLATLRAAAGGTTPDALVVVGSPAVRRVLMAALSSELRVATDRCHAVSPDAYARGGALLAARGEGQAILEASVAPYALGVIGVADNGVTMERPLIEAGQALPATARFTVVADRDAHKELVVTLTRAGANGDTGHRFAFGPLVGGGMQRIGITIEWRRDGSIEARAADRETALPLDCVDQHEIAGGVPLAAARHLRAA
jgi:hypothetical protein